MPKQPKALSKESLEYCARKSNEAQRKIMGLPKQQEVIAQSIVDRFFEKGAKVSKLDYDFVLFQIQKAKIETIESVGNGIIKVWNEHCKSAIPYDTKWANKFADKLKSYLKQRSYK